MRLYLKSENSDTLDAARVYLNDYDGEIKIVKEDGGSLECTADLPEEALVSLLDCLLNNFDDLDVTAVIISDVPGRDRSFWNTGRYKSAKDDSGRRYFEIERSVGWA